MPFFIFTSFYLLVSSLRSLRLSVCLFLDPIVDGTIQK